MSEEGKDWDHLIPFLLFAYREVPQESTGFSPFELLYGRDVRDIKFLRESWCGDTQSDQNVVAFVLLLRERMEQMVMEARENMESAQINRRLGTTRKLGNDRFNQETRYSCCSLHHHRNLMHNGRVRTAW